MGNFYVHKEPGGINCIAYSWLAGQHYAFAT